MTMDPALEATVSGSLAVASSMVTAAIRAEDTDAMRDAIRIARFNLIKAYDAITEAEQAARAKHWRVA